MLLGGGFGGVALWMGRGGDGYNKALIGYYDWWLILQLTLLIPGPLLWRLTAPIPVYNI